MKLYLQLPGPEKIFLEEFLAGPNEPEEVSLFVRPGSPMSGYYKILGMDEINALPVEYSTMCENLGIIGAHALHALPRRRLEFHIKDSVAALKEALSQHRNAEYLKHYLNIHGFLESLRRARVDVSRLETLIVDSKHSVVRNTLQSFLPSEDGLTRSIEYSTSETATGRLTVKSGPRILTATSAVRECFVSSFPQGRIIQLDIVAAEPTMALHEKGVEPPLDVYEYMCKELLGGNIERTQAKLVTLCALYGQSASRLKRKLPRELDAKKIIRKTREYFGSDELESALEASSRDGKLQNAFGRPMLLPDDDRNLMISYYLQSSIAECALLMFDEFVRDNRDRCMPLFVIHDAMLVDCDSELAAELVAKNRIRMSIGGRFFYLSVKMLTDN